MFKSFNIKSFLPQAISCLQAIIATPAFIVKNKLWNGFFEHKGMAIMAIVISVLFSWHLIEDMSQYFTAAPEAVENLSQEIIGDEMGAIPEVPESVKKLGKKAFLSGGSKYLFLILLEVLIFYFSVKTLSILRNKMRVPKVKDFIRAERRMIKVMLFNFIKGIVAQVIVHVICGILGLGFLTDGAMFFVYSYFIGYAFLDNYNEQFGNTIRESQTLIRGHLGAALMLGVLANICFYVPLIGPLVVPFVGAIAGTIYAFENKMVDEELKEINEMAATVS